MKKIYTKKREEKSNRKKVKGKRRDKNKKERNH